MKRLSQFLYKMLLMTLASIFISISTFPGEVIALDLSKIAPQFREQARQKEAQLRQLRQNVPNPKKIAPQSPEQEPQEEAQLPQSSPNVPDANDCPPFPEGYTQPSLPNLEFKNITTGSSSGNNLTADDSGSFSIGPATFQTVPLYNFTQNTSGQQLTPSQAGQYMPPVFQVAPGDTIDLTLNNNLTSTATNTDTNLHYHGFNVSPNQGADDVLIHVQSKDSYHMNFKIPEDHQPGLFWYHPHVHTDSDPQVLGGMSGGIIVKGIENYYSIINGIPLKQDNSTPKLTEQVLLFKDLQLQDTTATFYKCYTLNGLVNPQISIKAGEVQFWRIGNIGADTYMNLSLVDGNGTAYPFYILARDGNVVSQPIEQYQILLPPANRVEVLVIGGSIVGTNYNLVSDPVPNTDPNYTASGFDGNRRTVATVLVGAYDPNPVYYATESLPDYIKNQRSIIPLAEDLPSSDELAKMDIPKKHQRQFTFSQNTSNGNFVYLINSQTYDPERIDTTVQVGDIEEWTLVNATPVHHAFHIHQLDFIVTKVNDLDQPIEGYEDSIDLPPCAKGIGSDTCQPGTESKTVVRIPFTNPVIADSKYVGGEFVYHCHVLFHEDHGMMQNIQVLPAPAVKS